ncbi:MAG: ABC transporter permease [Aggregatilineales bacterium]
MAQNTITGQYASVRAETNVMQRLRWNINDTLVMTQRNLIYYTRQPQLIVFATIQPIMFVLLFAFVFGGAINTPDGNYINFLLPGIIVQTVMFAGTNTAVGLADDLSKGMIDRFRSLPMARSAVLAGRTLADAIRGLFTVCIMIAVGTLIGFRFQDGILNGVLGVAIAILFGFAFTWIFALVGLIVKTAETAQVAGFVFVFPLAFASSIFVPPDTMPDWLQVFANNQPVTAVANAVRGLFTGTGTTEEVLIALAWIAAMLIVFIPLSVRQYGKSV